MTRAQSWNAIIVGLAAFWALVGVGVAYAMANDSLPPSRYDHRPTKPPVWLVYPSIASWCHDVRAEACRIGVTADGRCVIVRVPHPTLPMWLVRRHEYGHCNGWAADHSA